MFRPPLDAKICYQGKVFLNNGALSDNVLNNCSWISKEKFYLNTNDPYFLEYYMKKQSMFFKIKIIYFVFCFYSFILAIYTSMIQIEKAIPISLGLFSIFFLVLFIISFFENYVYDKNFIKEMFAYYELQEEKRIINQQMFYINQELNIYKETTNFNDGNKVYFTICPYCGAGCDNNDKVCKYCGTSLLYNDTHKQSTNITKHNDINKELYNETKIKNEKFKKDMEIVKRYNDYLKKKRKKK